MSKKKYDPRDDWYLARVWDHGIRGMKCYYFQTHKCFQGARLQREINHYTEKEAWAALTPPRP